MKSLLLLRSRTADPVIDSEAWVLGLRLEANASFPPGWMLIVPVPVIAPLALRVDTLLELESTERMPLFTIALETLRFDAPMMFSVELLVSPPMVLVPVLLMVPAPGFRR